MSKWFYSVSRMLTLAMCVAGASQAVQAGDFSVATRDQVLILTSKIQATQFLTHATFGASQADIDALAAQMRTVGTIAAATAWIDAQANPAFNNAVSGHSVLERSYVDFDLQYASLYNRAGTAAANYTYTPNATTVSHRNAWSRTRYRQNAWWHRAIAGNDQLRQKMAWALAQILAVGQNANNFNEEEPSGTVTGGPARHHFHGMADYYDIFVRHAFGSYRTVLGHVTYHGIMGDWLSFRGNRRAQGGVFPDENYAREVMQLFTIGLDVLNDDGSPTTNPITATYDADDIREYAEVFTGLGYGYGTMSTTSTAYSPYTAGTSTDPNGTIKYAGIPMRMAPSQHDRSTKNLLNGLVLTNPNGANVAFPTTLAGEAQANAEIDAALDGLYAHPTCPPFIVNKLIQRFVKSNPSRAYMTRVVNVFKNNGSGVRGDLKAVVKAILLDPEAWQPIRVQFRRSDSKFIVSTMGTEDSRLQEPVLNYTRFTRFFKATAKYEVGEGGSNATADPFVYESDVPGQFRLNTLDPTFDQSPYEQPSVFNFYVADYQSPGAITTYASTSGRMQRGTAIFAPEFQIVNAITSNNTGNFYRNLLNIAGNSTVGNTNPQRIEAFLTKNNNPANLPVPHPNYSTQYENTQDITNVTTKSTRTVVDYDLSLERSMIALAAGFTPAQRDAAVDALLDHLDLYLCGGTLNQSFKASLRNATITEMNTAAAGGIVNNVSGNTEASNIVRGVVMSILASPSFLVTE
jgi:uncharacterized protein (DUF1800 family)